MAVAAHAVHAGLSLEMLVVAEVDQGVQPVDRLDPDIAALAPVAAVGAAILDVFLPPERHGAAAAVAGANVDLGFVEKFHVERPLAQNRSLLALREKSPKAPYASHTIIRVGTSSRPRAAEGRRSMSPV